MTEPPFSSDDYEAIAAAVMETERGRWFLTEYARRNRAADTAAILDALSELERRFRQQAPQADAGRMAHLLGAASERTRLLRNELKQAGAGKPVARALRQLKRLERLVALALSEVEPSAAKGSAAQTIAAEERDDFLAHVEEPAEGAPEHLAADWSDAGVEAEPRSDCSVSVNGHLIDLLAPAPEIESPPDHDSEEDADHPQAVVSADAIDDPGQSKAAAARHDDEAPVVFRPNAPVRPQQQVASAVAANAPLAELLATSSRLETPSFARFDPDDDSAAGASTRPPAAPRMPAAWMPSLLDDLSEEEKAILFA